MVVSFLVVNGRACGAADGWFLAAPVGLAFDDQLVCGGGEPAGGGLREQGVSHSSAVRFEVTTVEARCCRSTHSW